MGTIVPISVKRNFCKLQYFCMWYCGVSIHVCRVSEYVCTSMHAYVEARGWWQVSSSILRFGTGSLSWTQSSLIWLLWLLACSGTPSLPAGHWDFRWPPYPPRSSMDSGSLNSSLMIVPKSALPAEPSSQPLCITSVLYLRLHPLECIQFGYTPRSGVAGSFIYNIYNLKF